MRTTVTLDEDVAARLKAEARRQRRPFKEIVNDALRRGLAARKPPRARAPFRLEPRDLGGLRPGVPLDKVAAVIERLEGPRHR